MKLQIFTDGASRGNPGPSGIGIVIKESKKTILEISDYLGKTTNNIAEYIACLRGLTEALVLGAKEVELFADSELLVKQLNGEYKVKNEGIQPIFSQIQSIIKNFKKFSVHHTVRDGNKHADELANKGIDEHYKKDSPLFQ